MNTKNWTAVVLLLFLASALAIAQEDVDDDDADEEVYASDPDKPGEPDPLFASHDVLAIRIAAPMTTLMRERPNVKELKARLSYVDENGETIGLDIQIRTRGNFRRKKDVCPFAPIRLNFKKKQVKDTLFHKQDKLKLVTHCRSSSERSEQVVLREYLAYRMFNQLTDTSYRVRLLRITYVDNEKKFRETEGYGFVIEHKKRLGQRIDMPPIDIAGTTIGALVPEYTNLASVFQYFIGNTDFSPIAAAEGDTCCHNGQLFGQEGEPMYSVPYDFDMSGLVDAPYGAPNPAFGLRDNRQRLYRGRCVNNEHIPDTLQRFRDNRQVFDDLIEQQAEMTDRSRRRLQTFINRFYRVIDNPNAVENELVTECI